MASRLRMTTGAALLAGLCACAVAAACGARSELEQPQPRPQGEGGMPPIEAGIDATIDAPKDAPPVLGDRERPDAPPECDDPEVTWIYLVTSQHILVAYKPESDTFETIGTLDCASGSGPFSMAVDYTGIAYVLYDNGRIYAVSTADASCELTPFVPGPFNGSTLFGMGFARDPNGIDESLYVAEISFSSPSLGLGRIDHFTFDFDFVGPFSQNPGNAIELTPTGDGPLWGYFLNTPGPGGTLVEIDTMTGDILQAIPASAGNQSSALAVAWWGGAFYVFTSPGGGTNVTRVDPIQMTETQVAYTNLTVVGAGVSTCAPTSLP